MTGEPARRGGWVLALGEERLFLLLALVIGLLSGLSVVCFRVAIDWTRLVLLGSSLRPGWPRIVVVPVVAGLVVAALVRRVFPRVRGSGVNQTKAALYIYNGYIPFNTVIGKFLTCALAIGSGQSLGPEDPSLQIGAGLASSLGRSLELSRERLRLIAPVGAAAGLAAAFNAPIAAVLFVIEEVIGRWSAAVLGAVVVSAVSSVVVARWFLGDAPLFRVPAYTMVHPQELGAYALLGVVGGFASLVFVKLVGAVRPRLKACPGWTQYLQPAAAGLVLGIVGLWLPQILGAGYDYIDQAMHGQFSWQLLAVLGLAKILATVLSFVSGAPGGLFAPTLFIGAMVGAAVGELQRLYFPAFTGPVGTYALVGMGTLFAGILRAPMTSVFMVFEVSGSYGIMLPVIVSNTVSYLISRRFQHVPIFDLLTRQDGLDLPSMEEQRELPTLRVEDAMDPPDLPVLAADDRVGDAVAQIETGSGGALCLVRLEPGGWSVVEAQALARAAGLDRADWLIRDIVRLSRLPHVHGDQPLDFALSLLGDRALLPVVHRADYSRLEGILRLEGVLRAYRRQGYRLVSHAPLQS